MRGTTGRLDDFGRARTALRRPTPNFPSAPGTPSLTPVQPDPDRSHLGGGRRQRGSDALPHRALLGRGLRGLLEIATTASTSYPNTGLAAATSYTYRVRAQDAALNLGPYSGTRRSRDAGAARHRTPGAPGTPRAWRRSSPTQIDLTWAAASDNVGVTLYRIERCSGAGCADFSEIATTPPRATRTPASPRRPPTPTACVPRTLLSTSAPTRPLRRPRRRAAPSPRSSRCRSSTASIGATRTPWPTAGRTGSAAPWRRVCA